MTKAELALKDEIMVERIYDLWRAGYDMNLIAGDFGLTTEDAEDLVRMCSENLRKMGLRQPSLALNK